MTKQTGIIFLLIVFWLTSEAQLADSMRFVYNNQTIYRYGSSFLKGNERLSFSDLEKEFSMSDLGIDSYTKAKRYRTTSMVFRIGSMLSGLAAVAVASNSTRNRNTVYVLLGGQFAFAFGGSRYSSLSQQNLDRAIWQRNKDVLFPLK